MTDSYDNNLKNFLKRNQPTAPAPDLNEFNQILSKVQPPLAKSPFRSWFVVPTLIAASILAIWISVETPKNTNLPAPIAAAVPIDSRTVIDQDVELEVPVNSDEDDDTDLLAEELPTLEVGEDYLMLASL